MSRIGISPGRSGYHIQKLIDFGLIPARNEAEDIRGWAKTSLFFCKEVFCIVDSKSSDAMIQILRDEFPEVQIIYQNLSWGDSNDVKRGLKGEMSSHISWEYWVNRLAKIGNWFMILAPDERLDPSEWPMILEDLKKAQKTDCDGLSFPKYCTFYPDEDHVIDWHSEFAIALQIKFYKYTGIFEKGVGAHAGYKRGFPTKVYPTKAGFYHYCYVKDSRIPFGRWRDIQRFKGFPLIELKNPVKNWRNMDEIQICHEIQYKGNLEICFESRNEAGKLYLCTFPNCKYLKALPSQRLSLDEIVKENTDLLKLQSIQTEKTIKMPKIVSGMFELRIPKKPLNILLIGEKTTYCATTQVYYDLFLNAGCNVTWIGKGAPDLDFTGIPMKQIVFNGLMGSYPVIYREFKLQSILDLFPIKFDAIIQIQDHTYFTEEVASKIPFIYVLNQIHYPRVSNCVTMVLGASYNTMDQLKYYLTESIPIGYLPHALNPVFQDLDKNTERSVLVSFSGELYNPASLYMGRRETVFFLRDQLKEVFSAHWMGPPKAEREVEYGKGRLSQIDYRDLLLRSKFGLNCPTRSGFNFRDLEIPAAGAILLTKRNRDMEFLGFKHGLNCFFYDTKEEALEILQREPYNAEIAERGYILANQQIYQSRFNEIMNLVQEIMK